MCVFSNVCHVTCTHTARDFAYMWVDQALHNFLIYIVGWLVPLVGVYVTPLLPCLFLRGCWCYNPRTSTDKS